MKRSIVTSKNTSNQVSHKLQISKLINFTKLLQNTARQRHCITSCIIIVHIRFHAHIIGVHKPKPNFCMLSNKTLKGNSTLKIMMIQ